jgi:hypothetical protein
MRTLRYLTALSLLDAIELITNIKSAVVEREGTSSN